MMDRSDLLSTEEMQEGYYLGTRHVKGNFYFVRVFEMGVRIILLGKKGNPVSNYYPKVKLKDHALKPISKEEAFIGLL